MSVAYEPRTYHGELYPNVGEHEPSDLDRYADPDVSDVADLAAVAATTYSHAPSYADPEPTALERLESLTAPPNLSGIDGLPTMKDFSSKDFELKDDSPTTSANPTTPQSRVKPIPKPDRSVHKNLDGKYVCTWPNCSEEIKEFNRKCEWNKHMDKHERPYRCTAVGCEKLPGFTYSGGLLRHEREVHGKHGGPKNPLHCPHLNCKRHSGKGFSRQENLSEHLRRVHTGNGTGSGAEETDDGASETTAAIANGLHGSNKRKRDSSDIGGHNEFDAEGEIKRLRGENDELRGQIENQNQQIENQRQQILMMMDRIEQLDVAMGQPMGQSMGQSMAPTPSMH